MAIRSQLVSISIHAPRTGSDAADVHIGRTYIRFQSTLPARGATTSSAVLPCIAPNFNPRSPHGERRQQQKGLGKGFHFNPRSPHGERRKKHPGIELQILISIHAPRTGSDGFPFRFDCSAFCDFNPRSPHGERHGNTGGDVRPAIISIHAPRTGSDGRGIVPFPQILIFQSTLPARGATLLCFHLLLVGVISIHAPRTGSDPCRVLLGSGVEISIHAPRTGSDVRCQFRLELIDISIHAPRTGSDTREAVLPDGKS